jgi:type IV pilus assembly protein PilA
MSSSKGKRSVAKQLSAISAGQIFRTARVASKPTSQRQAGFSLIELLIVVAIILIIAAIAIPNLIRSRISANEASCVATLRTLNTSQVLYQTSYGSFSPNLVDIGPNGTTCGSTVIPTATAACLVDTTLASDPITKSGYTITYAPAGTPPATYKITALPIAIGVSGQRGFCTNQTMVIDVNAGGTACTIGTDPPL